MIDHKELLRRILKPFFMEKQPVLSVDDVKEKNSAVAIILRPSKKLKNHDNHLPRYRRQIEIMLDTEILLLQRVKNGKLYSGQICLPGGRWEEGETIVQTAIRETFQETGLVLSIDDLTGTFEERFLAYKRENGSLSTFASIFFKDISQDVILNKQEIDDYRWIPLRYFLDDSAHSKVVLSFENFTSLLKQFCEFTAVKQFQWPAINVGMEKELYGLTFYILAYFTSKTLISLKKAGQRLEKKEKTQQINNNKKKNIQQINQNLQEIIKSAQKLKNFYSKGTTIVWKEDTSLTQNEKQILSKKILQTFTRNLPIRPSL